MSDERLWSELHEAYPELVGMTEENYIAALLQDYEPLLRSFGYHIVIKIDDADYTGDSYVLYRNNYREEFQEDTGRFGILIFGWGSCSGCDALQGAAHLSDVIELRRELHRKIKWGTKEALVQWIDEAPERNEYYENQENAILFFKLARLYLSEVSW